MNFTTLHIWQCAARGCSVHETKTIVMSVFAAVDSRTAFPRPCPPEGWNVVEGRAYCGRHTIEVVATIRTGKVLQFPGGYGCDVETVRLRNAA